MTHSPLDTAVAALVGDPTALDSHGAEAKRLLDKNDNVILYGPPGTGKSRAAEQVADWWESTYGATNVFHTTFHPSYSYEDFVQGFRPKPDDPAAFILTPGVLLNAAKQAESGPTLLVIDEINRADVAKVFGELITYIEADKRGRNFVTAQEPTVDRTIPPDLFVLGTMNTADKSISLLDVALRRRFRFIECPPDPTAFTLAPSWKETAFGIDLGQLLTAINDRLLGAGVTRDRLVGHALLAIRAHNGAGTPQDAPGLDDTTDAELFDRLRYDVYPLIEEYLFGDADRMKDVLPGLVGDHGGILEAGLTPENVRSWLPGDATMVQAPSPDQDTSLDDNDASA